MLANGKQAGKGSITVGVGSISTIYSNIPLFSPLSDVFTSVAVDHCDCRRSPSWCQCVVFLLRLMWWFFFPFFWKITAQELSDNRIITLTFSGRKLDKKVDMRHPTTITTRHTHTHSSTSHSECISSALASGHTIGRSRSDNIQQPMFLCPSPLPSF